MTPDAVPPDLDVLARIAGDIRAAVTATGRPDPLVIIDGRSGSGKSTLARMLAAPGVDVLAMDSLYPGWDGLAVGSVFLHADVLAPRAAGRRGRWRRWDWDADLPAEEHLVPPGTPLIVEGAGSLTRDTAPLADVSVWLEAPADLRRERALARDGDAYAPHWERWAAQEVGHIERHDPRALASHVYDITACAT